MPEAVIQFDPNKKDLNFFGTDNLSNPEDIAIIDLDNIVTFTDQAGNVTELQFKEKNRKTQLKAEIKSLSYNNQLADIGKNKLAFFWLYDHKGNLKLLTQHVRAQNGFNILATYIGGNTLFLGRDSSGRISKTVAGLTLLQIQTDKGDLHWGY